MSTPEWVKTAKVGDKVVAVRSLEPHIRTGAVYTIRDIVEAWRSTGDIMIGIRLVEISRDRVMTCFGLFEADYSPCLFRPVQPRKTDISIFERMLNTAPAMEGA